MFDYLTPRDGPVIDGFEQEEHVYAETQPQYIPLRTLISADEQHRVLSRWNFTAEQRKAVAEGADIFLELSTFGKPLQPIRMAVSDGVFDPEWVKVNVLSDVPVPVPIAASEGAAAGNELSKAEAGAVETAVEVSAEDPTPLGMTKCLACGVLYTSGETGCNNCGAPRPR